MSSMKMVRISSSPSLLLIIIGIGIGAIEAAPNSNGKFQN